MSKKITNSLGIELPEYIEGYGKVKPFMGAFYYYNKESLKDRAERFEKSIKRRKSVRAFSSYFPID